VEETQIIIAQFQQTRANQLIANQPDLIKFLTGSGTPSFAAEVTDGAGAFDLVTDPNRLVWLRLSGSWTEDGTANGAYVFGAVGSHRKVSRNLLVGGMLQFDYLSEQDGISDIEGTGWMFGPYFVGKLPEHDLFIEGRLLYGETRNEISPFGTYTDDFDTERWLAQVKVAGELAFGNTTLQPSLQFSYTVDEQQIYTDGLGNLIPKQSIELGQLALGLDFNHVMTLANSNAILELTGGIAAIGTSTRGTGTAAIVVPNFEGGRARVELGSNYTMPNGGLLSISTFYDGIGASEYNSYGGEIVYNLEF